MADNQGNQKSKTQVNREKRNIKRYYAGYKNVGRRQDTSAPLPPPTVDSYRPRGVDQYGQREDRSRNRSAERSRGNWQDNGPRRARAGDAFERPGRSRSPSRGRRSPDARRREDRSRNRSAERSRGNWQDNNPRRPRARDDFERPGRSRSSSRGRRSPDARRRSPENRPQRAGSEESPQLRQPKRARLSIAEGRQASPPVDSSRGELVAKPVEKSSISIQPSPNAAAAVKSTQEPLTQPARESSIDLQTIPEPSPVHLPEAEISLNVQPKRDREVHEANGFDDPEYYSGIPSRDFIQRDLTFIGLENNVFYGEWLANQTVFAGMCMIMDKSLVLVNHKGDYAVCGPGFPIALQDEPEYNWPILARPKGLDAQKGSGWILHPLKDHWVLLWIDMITGVPTIYDSNRNCKWQSTECAAEFIIRINEVYGTQISIDVQWVHFRASQYDDGWTCGRAVLIALGILLQEKRSPIQDDMESTLYAYKWAESFNMELQEWLDVPLQLKYSLADDVPTEYYDGPAYSTLKDFEEDRVYLGPGGMRYREDYEQEIPQEDLLEEDHPREEFQYPDLDASPIRSPSPLSVPSPKDKPDRRVQPILENLLDPALLQDNNESGELGSRKDSPERQLDTGKNSQVPEEHRKKCSRCRRYGLLSEFGAFKTCQRCRGTDKRNKDKRKPVPVPEEYGRCSTCHKDVLLQEMGGLKTCPSCRNTRKRLTDKRKAAVIPEGYSRCVQCHKDVLLQEMGELKNCPACRDICKRSKDKRKAAVNPEGYGRCTRCNKDVLLQEMGGLKKCPSCRDSSNTYKAKRKAEISPEGHGRCSKCLKDVLLQEMGEFKTCPSCVGKNKSREENLICSKYPIQNPLPMEDEEGCWIIVCARHSWLKDNAIMQTTMNGNTTVLRKFITDFVRVPVVREESVVWNGRCATRPFPTHGVPNNVAANPNFAADARFHTFMSTLAAQPGIILIRGIDGASIDVGTWMHLHVHCPNITLAFTCEEHFVRNRGGQAYFGRTNPYDHKLYSFFSLSALVAQIRRGAGDQTDPKSAWLLSEWALGRQYRLAIGQAQSIGDPVAISAARAQFATLQTNGRHNLPR